ncbi:SusC/RagA family TonB-linked outer membrane protein [Fibrella aquatilis]|uniref:TonB-dependent receptor n=1 Tax=Fibrella aquatilis TaxID=2817059 RepID=A0A939G664_9BACT|nr:TonB-dependent receptor [Fibrella aquatilis]MBO0931933.1 TonB-dependent receptor [Fibrella aquatilis]
MKNLFMQVCRTGPVLLALLLGTPAGLSAQTLASVRTGQTARPAVSVRALSEVLYELKTRHQVNILFADQMVSGYTVASDAVSSRARLESTLDAVLKPFALRYKKVKDGTYLILKIDADRVEPKATLLKTAPTTQAVAEQPVSGRVTSRDNSGGLPGVSVVVKGTARGTTTDAEGRYQINVPDGTATLVFSYIGYLNKEVVVGSQSVVDLDMEADIRALSEVVVVGYGAVKRANLSGAVSTVSAQDLKRLPTSANLTQALQGAASGVFTSQQDRSPGARPSISIRGNNSFSGGTVLYVVDGFPLTYDAVSAISPNDIENVSILKDASSTAIYGARAANGVVLITTRAGRSNQSSLEVNVYRGVNSAFNPIKMLNGADYAALRREAYANDGAVAPFLPVEQQQLDKGETTDWWQSITNAVRPVENYQVAFTGGTDRSKVFVSGNFFNEAGLINGSGFKRGSIRGNITQRIGQRFTLTSNTNLAYTEGRGISNNTVLYSALIGNPLSPIRDANGQYYTNIQGLSSTPRSNPVAFSDLSKYQDVRTIINSTLALTVDLTEGLKLRVQGSGEINNRKEQTYVSSLISADDETNGRVAGGLARVVPSVNYNYLGEAVLNYDRTFGGKHTVSGLAGVSTQANRYEWLWAQSSGFSSDVFETYNLNLGTNPAVKPQSYLEEWKLMSYIGRAVYTFNDKYILTGNFRADGSSRFGANNKWGIFPSGAFAWRMAEEPFIKNLGVFNDLKLRTSYGLAGNAEAIGVYGTLSRLGYAPYNFNGKEAVGYEVGSIAAANLKWETTKQFDLGLDVSVLNNRVNLTADYYHKNTVDIIRNLPLLAVSGFQSVPVNVGTLENRGWELGLNTLNIDKAIKWRTTLLVSRNRQKLLNTGDGSDRIGTTHWVGQPLGYGDFRYIVRANGIWQTSEAEEAKKYGDVPGNVKYIDQNNDGKIDNANDRVFTGSIQPNFYGSFTNDLTYKGFSLNVFTTFEQGRDVYNGQNYILLSGTGFDNNRAEMLNRWTPTNPSNQYPRASKNSTNRRSFRSSEFLEDASFFKIRSVTLSYQLPDALLRKASVRSARFYVSGTNLARFTKYTGMDPEDYDYDNTQRAGAYPVTRSFLFGLDLRF